MTAVSNKNTHIVVFRGGKLNHKDSVKEGKDIFSQLAKHNISFSDVYIDEEGNAIKDGSLADMHHILSNSDAYIDTTGHNDLSHHKLATKLGLKKLFSEKETTDISLDRENIYRLLRLNDILVPDTYVIRKENNDFLKDLKKVWETFHTPLLVRVLIDTNGFPSKLIRGFHELVEVVTDLHNRGHDIHILNYKSMPTYSVAVIPNFRGEEYYVPMAVEVLIKRDEVPNKNSILKVFVNASDKEKNKIYSLAKEVAGAIDAKAPICVDIINHKGKLLVVNINLKPSLSFDSRFIKSLESTGVSIGNLIEKQIS